MQVTATQAKNQFGQVCTQALQEPVFVEKNGRVDTVILSLAQFEALRQGAQHETLAQRRRAFNAQYRDWLDEQNRDFETRGLWCDGLVAWQGQED